jgi:hypothetical protein
MSTFSRNVGKMKRSLTSIILIYIVCAVKVSSLLSPGSNVWQVVTVITLPLNVTVRHLFIFSSRTVIRWKPIHFFLAINSKCLVESIMANFIAVKMLKGRCDRSVSKVTNCDADKQSSISDRDIFFSSTTHLGLPLGIMGTFPWEKIIYYLILMPRS